MARREVRLAVLGDSRQDTFAAHFDFFVTNRDAKRRRRYNISCAYEVTISVGYGS
jgi:hypothetical protein